MLAVQKPISLFSQPAYTRPSHSRHPSAPAVVRPTQTPGLLSVAKPSQQPSNRPQQSQQYGRASRSPKNKQQRPAPTVEDDKKAQSPKQRSDKALTTTSSPAPEKRGRQPKSTAVKDKADRRSPSASARASARRLPHQPSPPPAATIPQQTNTSARPNNSCRPHSFAQRNNETNSFDPFATSSGSETESSSPSKTGQKQLAFQVPLTIASQPTGKLARRRQSGQVPTTPTPKAVPMPRSKHTRAESQSTQQARSVPINAPVTPKRPASRRVSTGLPVADWDDFPVCDESFLSTPISTTIVRESASAPPKQQGVTWQQTLFGDGPHTAPISSTFAYPFANTAYATPSPAQRRRNHRRVPSEGVFAMSMDEDSSSDSSDESKTGYMGGMLPPFNPHGHIRRTPSPPAADEFPATYFAGSVFQNSPSPDELPVPAFRA